MTGILSPELAERLSFARPAPTTAWCAACQCQRPVDRHWRALWIDSDGDFVSTLPECGCDLDFERPGTVFACGQLCALKLFERYLQSGGFEFEANALSDEALKAAYDSAV